MGKTHNSSIKSNSMSKRSGIVRPRNQRHWRRGLEPSRKARKAWIRGACQIGYPTIEIGVAAILTEENDSAEKERLNTE